MTNFGAQILSMAKFTPAYLKKLEDTLESAGYDVRYEKGNFKSNYCLLEAKKVVVINKFSTLESRIQSLIEILVTLTEQGLIQVDLREAGIKRKINLNDSGVKQLVLEASDQEVTSSDIEDSATNL